MWRTLAMLLTATVALSAAGQRDVFPGVGEYYFNGIPGNWTQAYKQCRASGGHLAVIDSPAEADAIHQMMEKFDVTSIHSGFHDQFVEGAYVTVLGGALPVQGNSGVEWGPGSPRGSGYDCGGYRADGIEDIPCAAEKTFICELSSEEGGEETLPGYEHIEGHGNYKYHVTNKTWPLAWDTCRQEGTNMAVLNSRDEMLALHERFNYMYAWVGVHRYYGGNRDFVTVLDEPLKDTGFTEWYGSMEPYGTYISHPYVAVYNNNGIYMLPGDVSMGFVCEEKQ